MTDGIIQQVFNPRIERLSKEPPKYYTFEQRAIRDTEKEILESMRQELVEKIKQEYGIQMRFTNPHINEFLDKLIGENE